MSDTISCLGCSRKTISPSGTFTVMRLEQQEDGKTFVAAAGICGNCLIQYKHDMCMDSDTHEALEFLLWKCLRQLEVIQ